MKKRGRSPTLRLARLLANKTHTVEGARVEFVRREGGLMLHSEQPQHYRLSELLMGVTRRNRHPEAGWGRLVGREVLEAYPQNGWKT